MSIPDTTGNHWGRADDARQAIARLKAEQVEVNGQMDRAAKMMRDGQKRLEDITSQIAAWERHLRRPE